MKATYLILLAVLTVSITACGSFKQKEIATEVQIRQEIQTITKQEVSDYLTGNPDASETAWTISLCLLKKGADEDFVKRIYEKIFPKVKMYKQVSSPAKVATDSYAGYIRSIINEEIAKISP